jgi:transcriptional regulator with XRE-family HTH domain
VPKADDLVGRVTRQLAELRRAAKVTQEGLADLLDSSVQHVSRIEGGQNVTLETLEKLASALGYRVIVAFEPTGEGLKKRPTTRRQRTAALRAENEALRTTGKSKQ